MIQSKFILNFPRFSVLNFWPRLGRIIFREWRKQLFEMRDEQVRILIPLIRARVESNRTRKTKEELVAYVDTLVDLVLPEEKRKLEEEEIVSLRMKDYQAIAMIVLLGPMLKHIQNQTEEDVKKTMSQRPSISSSKPNFIVSCSRFGPKGMGAVIRVASTTTEANYNFMQHQLGTMEELLGAPPYR